MRNWLKGMLILPLLMLIGCNSSHTETAPIEIWSGGTSATTLNSDTPVISQDQPSPAVNVGGVTVFVWDTAPALDLKMQASDLDFSDVGHIDAAAAIDGINKYPGAELNGCVNDAKKIAYVHIKWFGYKRENVKLLLDGAATTANLKAAYVWLAAKTHPIDGDKRLMWHSGHGAEDAVSSDANSEPDHLNQLMCPVDFDWSREHELIDKDLVAIFGQMPPGVIFNWGSDSCHSGDLDRRISKKKYLNKRYPNTPDYVTARVNKVKKAQKKEMMHRGLVNGLLDVGYISGCRPEQLSADTTDENGVPCGEMTDTFIKVLQNHLNDPLDDIAKNMVTIMQPYDQTPVSEGARHARPWQQK